MPGIVSDTRRLPGTGEPFEPARGGAFATEDAVAEDAALETMKADSNSAEGMTWYGTLAAGRVR